MATAGVLPKDQNFIAAVGGVSSATDSAASIRPFQYDTTTRGLTVHIVGIDTILGLTQYTEGDTDTTITGTAMLMEGASSTLLPIQGTVADGLLVNLGTNNDITVTSGTITSITNAVAVTNTGLTELAAAINASSQMDVNIAASGATVPVSGTFWQATQPVSNAGTFAVQDSQDVMLGTDFSNVLGTASLITTTQADDLVNTTDTINVSALGYVFDGTTWDRQKGDSTDGTLVNLGTNNDVTLASITSSVVPGTGATNLGKAEDAGHTSGDTGVMNLGVRNDTPNVALAGTDLDYIPTSHSKSGAIHVIDSEEDFAVLGSNKVNKTFNLTGAQTDAIIWSPAAGKRWYITDIHYVVSAAATVTFEDDLAAGDSVVGIGGAYAANSGMSRPFKTPVFSGEDASDLLLTTSAGNIQGIVTGYEV